MASAWGGSWGSAWGGSWGPIEASGTGSAPVRGEPFTLRVSLEDAGSRTDFKITPTIAAGDFKVDVDGAGFNNLSTLPSENPAASGLIKIALTGAEMDGDVITVTGIDQTPSKEWSDFFICIITQAA